MSFGGFEFGGQLGTSDAIIGDRGCCLSTDMSHMHCMGCLGARDLCRCLGLYSNRTGFQHCPRGSNCRMGSDVDGTTYVKAWHIDLDIGALRGVLGNMYGVIDSWVNGRRLNLHPAD